MFDQDRQRQLFDERRLMQNLTQEEYSLYASPGSQRRPKSYSNDPMRNPFRDDNHRINIVVSSPQRYVRSKRRLESVLRKAPTFSSLEATTKLRQNEPPQYRPTIGGLARHSADPAWINLGAPLVDYWQESSPSSICSQSGWSGGYAQDSLEQTPAHQAQRASRVPSSAGDGGVGGNPGDKLTQQYQSEHRISSSRDHGPISSSADKRRAMRHDAELHPAEGVKNASNVNVETRMSRQYVATGASTSGILDGKQTSNQYEDGTIAINRYANSNFETADSNSKVRYQTADSSHHDCNMGTKNKLTDATVGHGEPVCGQQRSLHTQTEMTPTPSSGCPLFSGR